MQVWTKEELLEFHGKAEKLLLTHKLLTCCRDLVAVQLIAFTESADHTTDVNFGKIPEIETSDLVTGADILAFALWFVYKDQTPCKCSKYHQPESKFKALAEDFLTQVANFAALYDYIRMCTAGHATVFEYEAKSLIFRQAETTSTQMQCLERMSLGARTKQLPSIYTILSNLFALTSGQITGISTWQLFYKRDISTLLSIKAFFKPFYDESRLFENINTSLSYSLEEFHEVWLCLVAIVMLHGRMTKVFQKLLPTQFLKSIDIVMSRRKWIKLLCQLTDIHGSKISNILDDITYHPASYKTPDRAPLPPFISTQDRLLLLNRVVTTSIGEQDLYRLFELIRPEVNTVMKARKEELQLDRLRELFSNTGVEIHGPFKKVFFEGKETDLDVILYSRNQKVALCCQLKWPAPPRWRKDYSTVANDIDSGIKQTVISLGWLDSKPVSVKNSLQLSDIEFTKLRFLGLVISEKSIGGGLAQRRWDIPVTNEAVLRTIISQLRRIDLELLWQNTKSALVLPIEGIDYCLKDIPGTYGSTEFIFERGLSIPLAWIKNQRPNL